jgi:hypothetical protein
VVRALSVAGLPRRCLWVYIFANKQGAWGGGEQAFAKHSSFLQVTSKRNARNCSKKRGFKIVRLGKGK